MIDVSAENGWLATTLRIINVMQQVLQGRWVTDSPFLVLPHIEPHMLYLFRKKGLHAIPQIWDLCQNQSIEPLAKILRPEMDENMIDSDRAIYRKYKMVVVFGNKLNLTYFICLHMIEMSSSSATKCLIFPKPTSVYP